MDLVTRTAIKETTKKLQAAGKKVVLTNGCFDILHVGHVRYLAGARSLGDCLIVGLNSDTSVKQLKGSARPVNSEKDRAEVLLALSSVDYVVIFNEQTAEELVREIQPDIYAKGGDYTLDTLPEAEAVASYGGQIIFVPLVPGKSTTAIINKAAGREA